jgi:hypothetical protein
MRHLPKDHRAKSTWQHVAAELDKAAEGADVADPRDEGFSSKFQLALFDIK